MTPAATLGSSLRHNKISPYEDATARLAGSTRDDTEKVVASPIVLPAAAHASRSASRSRNGNGNGGSAYSSTARLRAWRDEDEDEAADLEDGGLCTAKEARKQQSVQLQTSAVKHFAPLHVGPPPKVRRLQASAAVPQQTSSASSAGADPHQAVGLVRYWLQRHSGSSSSVVVGLGLASLGSCAAQRLGVIAAEQDRLKDQFVRELTTGLTCIKASCDGDGLGTALASVAATYSQIAAEMVGRQQLELQGACAADFIVTQKALQSHSCLDSVKVQFRYAGLLGATAELEAIDKIQEMRV